MSTPEKSPIAPSEKVSTPMLGESGFESEGVGQLMAAPVFQLMASDGNDGPPIQRKESGGGMPGDLVSGFAASTGHDLSDVNVHYNSDKPSQVGALAYAQGNDIHLGAGQEQHLAHEAAHVVQQREGRVQPTTEVAGMPVNDNKGLESEADNMGAKAMQMKSESNMVSPSRNVAQQVATAQRKVVTQRMVPSNVAQLKKVSSFFGEFEDKKYTAVGDYGVDFEVEFRPFADKVTGSKIGLVQSVRSQLGGVSTGIHPTQKERTVQSGVGEGQRIDRLSSYGNPMYAATAPAAKDELGTTSTSAGWGQHATKNGDGTWNPAILKDKPTLPGHGENSSQVFETAALGLDGNQKDTYMGSVKWGWNFNAGKLTMVDFDIVSNAIPSAGFLAAANVWNGSHTSGTMEVHGTLNSGNAAQAYKGDHTADFTVSNGVQVTLINTAPFFTHIHNNEVYVGVQITVGTNLKNALMKVSDVRDKGDGGATIDLPTPDIYINPAVLPIFSDAEMRTRIKDLPANTRMENTSCTIHNSYGMRVVAGDDLNLRGFVDQTRVQRER
jgi:hypothetical protein